MQYLIPISMLVANIIKKIVFKPVQIRYFLSICVFVLKTFVMFFLIINSIKLKFNLKYKINTSNIVINRLKLYNKRDIFFVFGILDFSREI